MSAGYYGMSTTGRYISPIGAVWDIGGTEVVIDKMAFQPPTPTMLLYVVANKPEDDEKFEPRGPFIGLDAALIYLRLTATKV